MSTEPTLAVMDNPDGCAVAFAKAFHGSSPQDFAPQPVF